jgi:hypothetical protein
MSLPNVAAHDLDGSKSAKSAPSIPHRKRASAAGLEDSTSTTISSGTRHLSESERPKKSKRKKKKRSGKFTDNLSSSETSTRAEMQSEPDARTTYGMQCILEKFNLHHLALT